MGKKFLIWHWNYWKSSKIIILERLSDVLHPKSCVQLFGVSTILLLMIFHLKDKKNLTKLKKNYRITLQK